MPFVTTPYNVDLFDKEWGTRDAQATIPPRLAVVIRRMGPADAVLRAARLRQTWRGRPDRSVDASARRVVKLLTNGTPKTYPGFSHGMLAVNPGVLNADILDVIKV